jgi:putative polyketide hydroxylase
MTYDERRTAQVLIAGAGPAGLTAAIALGRQGIDTLVVDRKHELSSLPRATVISTRSMELLRSWGLEPDILAGAVEVAWQMWRCESLALSSAGSPVPVGLPTREQSAVVSPAAPECVPQDHTERVLLDHARSLGSVRVELGTEIAGAESDEDGARVVLRDAPDGPSRVIHARYLIAADGAHSAVRNALGIAVHGPGRFLDAASVLFRAPLWDVAGPHRYGIYDICHPEAPGALLPAGRGDRWVYGVRWEPGTRQPMSSRKSGSPTYCGSRRASRPCSRRSTGSVASRSPRNWRSASAAAARSSWVTLRTACPRAAAPG